MGSNNFEEWYYRFLKSQAADTPESEKEEELLEVCKETAKLLPDEGIDSLYKSEDCLLCADEKDIRKKSCYAQTDLGHEQPKHRKDKKYSHISSGAYLPINISCCSRCKLNYLAVDLIPALIGIIIMGITIILFGNRGVRDAIIDKVDFLNPAIRPFLVFALIFVITLTICALLRRLLYDVFSKKTHFDIFEINDTMKILKALGWFKLYENTKGAQLVFAKELPNYLQDNTEHTTKDSEKQESTKEEETEEV